MRAARNTRPGRERGRRETGNKGNELGAVGLPAGGGGGKQSERGTRDKQCQSVETDERWEKLSEQS